MKIMFVYFKTLLIIPLRVTLYVVAFATYIHHVVIIIMINIYIALSVEITPSAVVP